MNSAQDITVTETERQRKLRREMDNTFTQMGELLPDIEETRDQIDELFKPLAELESKYETLWGKLHELKDQFDLETHRQLPTPEVGSTVMYDDEGDPEYASAHTVVCSGRLICILRDETTGEERSAPIGQVLGIDSFIGPSVEMPSHTFKARRWKTGKHPFPPVADADADI